MLNQAELTHAAQAAQHQECRALDATRTYPMSVLSVEHAPNVWNFARNRSRPQKVAHTHTTEDVFRSKVPEVLSGFYPPQDEHICRKKKERDDEKCTCMGRVRAGQGPDRGIPSVSLPPLCPDYRRGSHDTRHLDVDVPSDARHYVPGSSVGKSSQRTCGVGWMNDEIQRDVGAHRG